MRTRPLLALTVVVASLLLGGCSSIPGVFGDAMRGDDGAITEAGVVSTGSLMVGDCFGDTNRGGAVSSVAAIPCEDPHVYEVFHDFSLPAGDFPGDAEFEEATYAECDPAFEQFVGVAYEESELEYFFYTPTEEGWSAYDDRRVSCVIGTEGVRVTGSAAGSAR
jgi:hypothetical protein